MRLSAACLTSQQHARVYLRDGSATLREKLRIKLSTSPGHSKVTPGQPVPALTNTSDILTSVVWDCPAFPCSLILWTRRFWHYQHHDLKWYATKKTNKQTKKPRETGVEIIKVMNAHSAKQICPPFWLLSVVLK